MNDRISAIGEMFRARLWPLGALAAAAAVFCIALVWALRALARSGRLPTPADPSRRSLLADLGYVLLSPVTELVSRTFTTLAVVGCAVATGRAVSPALLEGFGPVLEQPTWLMVVEMIVISDFVYYWTHRMAHTLPILWRFHAVHHSTRHMRWSSALRAHPAEAYAHVMSLIPLALLGFPPKTFAALAPFVTLYALVIHVDSRFAVRGLAYVMNSPRFHGWHHARDVDGAGVNFAGFFPIWDRLFGTYHLPEERPDAVGIRDEEMPDTCAGQLAYPFRSHPDGAEEPAASHPIHAL